MIGFLRGVVMHGTTVPLVTLVCNDVGHEVHCNEYVTEVGTHSYTSLWIHEHAPQDAPHELYGFRERSARDLFRRLLDVKGVGPKVGMRIVASGAVASGGAPDLARLASVRGVGAKLIAAICEAFT